MYRQIGADPPLFSFSSMMTVVIFYYIVLLFITMIVIMSSLHMEVSWSGGTPSYHPFFKKMDLPWNNL